MAKLNILKKYNEKDYILFETEIIKEFLESLKKDIKKKKKPQQKQNKEQIRTLL